MKKLVFSLALLLMSLSAAMAQTWDFNEEGVGATDIANLTADTEHWTPEVSTAQNRFKSKGNYNEEELKANGAVLDYTAGLLFTINKDDAVRIDVKGSRIALNQKSTITIRGLKKGFVVKVACQSSSKNTARSLTATNVTPATTKDFSAAGDNTAVTYTGTVAADGNITLSNSGGLYVYSISVIDPDQETPDEPGAFHNVSSTKVKNQMVLTMTDGTRYYNTNDVKVGFNQAKGVFTVSSKNDSWSDVYVGKVTDVSFVKAQLEHENGNITNQTGQVTIKTAQAWLQSAFVEWLPYEGASTYHIYIKGGQYSDFTKIDYQLVRDYGTYGRADALGLKAGDYEMKVVPVVNDAEVAEAANVVTGLRVRAHDRSGFAFNTAKTPGAYNADGTLKANAVVVYLTNDNIDKVTLDVVTSASKGTTTTCTGLQDIINKGIKKGEDARPFVFRLIGQIKTPSNNDKGDIVLDMNGKDTSAGVTIEGVGNDAVADGWGIRFKGARYAELSNMGFMNCSSGEGDDVGLQQDNEHIWVHNCDMFYGNAGSDADQVKGDGALDCKKSNYVTFSYNHFWDNGKSNLLGLSEGASDKYYITYHHNWYDHSDSRHPRVRYYSAHIYNNYYDGNAKYGAGSTLGSSLFVENNYFRNTNKPMMISQQGTDIKGNPKGTFSGEDGGVIKAYGNAFVDMTKLSFVPYSENKVDFDAYVASARDEQVPAEVTSKKGGNKYNNFDTNSAIMYAYTPDAAEDVPAVVVGQFGAGRVQHGDFQWAFDNSVDDASYAVNQPLKDAISRYQTQLVKIFGGENINVDPTPDPDPDPTPDPDPDQPDAPVIEGTVLVTFTGKTPSSSVVKLMEGSYSMDKGSATIDGNSYNTCIKMESKTKIQLAVDKKVEATFYFGDKETASMKIDDKNISGTGSTYATTLAAGTYLITKDAKANLFGIKLVPITE